MTKISNKEHNLKDMFNELIKEANANDKKYQSYKLYVGEIRILEENIKK
jgi:hypothetical protein